jgi:glycosyltransferase involved in cell wall biosynthesis
MTMHPKPDQAVAKLKQSDAHQIAVTAGTSENSVQHVLRIIHEEGILRFLKLSLRVITSRLALLGYKVRFFLTKPRDARVIQLEDIETAPDRMVRPEQLETAEPGLPFTHSAKILEGDTWYNRMLPERKSLISQGRELFNNRRVLFVLPVLGAGGGSNSVFLAVQAMQKMGVDAQIMNLEANRKPFLKSYPNVNVPLFFGQIDDIPALAGNYDAVVATSNITVAWIAPAAARHPGLVTGYYIQDYEAYFYPEGSEGYRKAAASYTMLPEQVRCVTTQWILDQIELQHGLACHLVGGHIDTDLFRPRPLAKEPAANGKIRIAAMIRPVSERRNPRMTMQILEQAYQKYGSRLEFILFGCEPYDPGFAPLPKRFPWQLAGELRPAQIANLLNQADIFVDYSTFQALGLTALEAMACGVAAIVPSNGGTGTFARHEENCLVVDSHDQTASYAALERLIDNEGLRYKLQRNAIATGLHYYPELPALNILKALFA